MPNASNDTAVFNGFGYGKVIVDEKGIVRSANEYEFASVINRIFFLEPSDVTSKEASEALGQYWHAGKSWRFFKDPTMSTETATESVNRVLDLFAAAHITVDDERKSLEYVREESHPRGKLVEIGFGQGESLRVLFAKHHLGVGQSSARAKLFLKSDSDALKATLVGAGDFRVEYSSDGTIQLKGAIESRGDDKRSIDVQSNFNESAAMVGTTKIQFEDEQATLSGEIGMGTYRQISEMIEHHPNVKTLFLVNVSGDVNDEPTRMMGQMIREAKIRTHIPSQSRVTSGGADLFFAGTKRTIAPGGLLGTLSWSEGAIRAEEFPIDHPAHQRPRSYWMQMLGESVGREFYTHVIDRVSEKTVAFFKPSDCEKWNLTDD